MDIYNFFQPKQFSFLNIYSYTLVAICLIIIGIYFHKNKFNIEERFKILVLSVSIVLVILLAYFLSAYELWRRNTEIFTNQINYSADYARVVYESRSLFGISVAMIIASLAFIVPILLFSWNNSLKFLYEQYEKIKNYCSQIISEQELYMVNKEMEEISSLLAILNRIKNWFRIPFYFSVVFSSSLLVYIAKINLSPEFSLNIYSKAVCVFSLSVFLLLCYISLFLVYLIGVQAEARKHYHLNWKIIN